jgi:hypothetical protein
MKKVDFIAKYRIVDGAITQLTEEQIRERGDKLACRHDVRQ